MDESGRRSRGSDPIVLRIPRTGGSVRAYLYPKLDSVIWTGQGMSIQRAMAFDREGGILAIVDGKGNPARIDLRFGSASVASRAGLTSLASVNGADIYGVDGKGAVNRLTRTGDWKFTPPSPARFVFPQLDGSLVVASQRDNETVVWKLRPPETKLLDTVTFSTTPRGVHEQVGDRVYFSNGSGLVGVRTRDMSVVTPIELPKQPKLLSPTPSGDRMYVAIPGEKGLSVVDRYTDKVATTIDLPGEVAEIRMDPLGRYVIARPVRGDSAWVIAVATDRVVGAVQTRWTTDLPACAPDGAIAVSNGRDVSFVDGETLQSVRTIVGGAQDYWYFMFWNGFRPRLAGIEDQPPREAPDDDGFGDANSADLTESPPQTGDSTQRAGDYPPSPPSQPQLPPAPQPTPTQPQVPVPQVPVPPAAPPELPPRSQSQQQSFTVSFAALLNEAKAHELANNIIVNGIKARVIKSQRAGTPIFRVILGPYPTRTVADQVGKDSGRQYWIITGEP